VSRRRRRGSRAWRAPRALVMTDPDAPGATFVHWTRFAMRAAPSGALTGGLQGETGKGETGYASPCRAAGRRPPPVRLHAVRPAHPVRLRGGRAKPADVTAARQGSVLARGTLTARYGR